MGKCRRNAYYAFPTMYSMQLYCLRNYFTENVIPDLIRNPVFSWIPAFAGMTTFGTINVDAK
jgi:hypothetical protein